MHRLLEGYSCWQEKTLSFIREKYGESVKVGAGNVVDRDGFLFLKGRGGLREGGHRRRLYLHHPGDQGHRPGQATALIEVAAARDEYYRETGVYVPICSTAASSTTTI